MTLTEAAERLHAAELELRAAQDEHDGSSLSAARYQAAVAELLLAEAVAEAVLREEAR